MGSAVDSANLTRELKDLSRAGFGGVEVTAIYGVRGSEPAYVPYLSPRWVALLSHTIRQAHQLGMGVDMPPGSGWRTGGPFVDSSDANASIQVTVDTVAAGTTWSAELSHRHIEAIVAFSSSGDIAAIARGQPLTPIRWLAPNVAGRWLVYVAGTRLSGDNVKRPAPGGEGFAIDVFSRKATEDFFRVYGERLDGLPKGAIGAYFHDSFEYTGDGTRGFFDEFRKRRGYDLARELPAFTGTGDRDRVARVKSDYRQTLDELLLENFLAPLASWSHSRGSVLRQQAHGSPGNLLDLYAAADIPETEIFGPLAGSDADALVNKFASSAAHITGKRLASAEAFTWLGEHFSTSLGEVKEAADQLFLTGINHLVYHGTAYSPRDVAWPGWEFYASMEFNSRNAFWRDLPTLNRYVARAQAVLQEGEPDNDVLLYWPIWDNWHDAAGRRLDFRVHDPTWLRARPIGDVAAMLWARGYGFDYISDRQLRDDVTLQAGELRAGGAPYRAIVVPRTSHMPPMTLERLIALARDGATVIFVDSLPSDVPGLGQLDERRARLAADRASVPLGAAIDNDLRVAALARGRIVVGHDLAALLATAGVRRERLVDRAGLRVLRQRWAGRRQYFLTYDGRDTVDEWLPLADKANAVLIMDPMTGRTGVAETRASAEGSSEVHLQLEPGASLFLRAFDVAPRGTPRWRYRKAVGAARVLRGRWLVKFLEGGPALPAAFQADSVVPWSARGDSAANAFAGTARYTLRFDAPDQARVPNYLLDLGRVAESARVRLNGKELGTLVARPFTLETGPLRARGNVLEIEVTNLSANRVRDLDRRGVSWKIFHDINYVGLDYKPFDASSWPVRVSGLVGPVTLTPLSW
jgi:glycosyl hydrolase family 106( putative alpha-L-rhamnosidase)